MLHSILVIGEVFQGWEAGPVIVSRRECFPEAQAQAWQFPPPRSAAGVLSGLRLCSLSKGLAVAAGRDGGFWA